MLRHFLVSGITLTVKLVARCLGGTVAGKQWDVQDDRVIHSVYGVLIVILFVTLIVKSMCKRRRSAGCTRCEKCSVVRGGKQRKLISSGNGVIVTPSCSLMSFRSYKAVEMVARKE